MFTPFCGFVLACVLLSQKSKARCVEDEQQLAYDFSVCKHPNLLKLYNLLVSTFLYLSMDLKKNGKYKYG